MKFIRNRSVAISLMLVTVIALAACAARGPRNKAQVGALTAGELALAIDQNERQAYAAGLPGYDKAAHDRVGVAVTKVLYATRAYERAVAAWPADNATAPAGVEEARKGLNAALTDLEQAIPAIAGVRDPLNRAISALKAALASPSTAVHVVPIQLAQLPGGGVMAFMAFMQLFASLLSSGRTTYEKVRSLLEKEGATPEELADLDVRLSGAIAAREAEHGAGPT